jgi:hypothetical protein
MTRWMTALGLSAIVVAPGVAAAASPAPAAGNWATYRRTSPVTQTVSVLTEQPPAPGGGKATWSVTNESLSAPEVFVTYGVVRADPKTYVLQLTTHIRPDGPPLSVTQVTVDKATGKSVRSVIRKPKGVSPTPEDGLRPFSRADIGGTPESVTVPAGTFQAAKGMAQGSTVWVADKAGPLNLVKMVGPRGTMELVKEGTGGVKDLLRP